MSSWTRADLKPSQSFVGDLISSACVHIEEEFINGYLDINVVS